MKRRRLTRGTTLLETLTVATMSCFVLTGAVGAFLATSAASLVGQSKLDTQTGAQNAVRVASLELREALSVTVDSDGRGLSYTKPAKQANGTYTMPLVTDGVNRRIWLTNTGRLMMTGINEDQPRLLCRGVVTTDPTTNQTYRIFTAGSGMITRSLTIQVVSQASTTSSSVRSSRARESVFLRNVPELRN